MLVELHPVQDDEAPPVVGVAGHERLGKIIQAGAVDHHLRLSDRVDERPARGVPQDKDRPPLGPVEKRLPHVAVDHQFPRSQDLAQLILGVAMDGDLQPIHSGPQVIARASINIDPRPLRSRAQAAPDEPLAPAPINDELSPAEVVCASEKAGRALFALRPKIPRHPRRGPVLRGRTPGGSPGWPDPACGTPLPGRNPARVRRRIAFPGSPAESP